MKRWLALLATITFTFISLPVANASTTIFLSEPTHRQINGEFIDDDLAALLGESGRLGEVVFNPPPGNRTWVIDPALLEEVAAMADGYTLTSGAAGAGQSSAQSWLTQLKLVTRTDTVVTMAYGNPSGYWVRRLAPHDVNYLLSLSGVRLAEFLGREVVPATSYRSNSQFTLTNSAIEAIKGDALNFAQVAPYGDPKSIDTYRLALLKLLNPTLGADRRDYLIRDFTATAFDQIHLVHLSPGKFTITSSHQNLPITITNGFPTDIKVNLYVIPTNLKVEVGNLPQVSISAHSKTQVMVPVTVLTSGTSGLNVVVTSSNGDVLGEPIIYPLQLSVINPIATWVTTGAAVLLFVAATIQSVRRIRRRQR